MRYGVALVLRGGKGTGKGRFAHYFGQLFGPHFVLLSNSSQLTGKFNNHLGTAMLVCADESSWGGNKTDEGVLKSLITEDTMMLEHKGVDSVPIKNHTRYIFTSNEYWAVPVTPGERRFFILDVNPVFQHDTDFWNRLDHQMTNGGLEGLMYYLLNREITTNQRIAPKTEALIDIASKGMNDIETWVFDCLTINGMHIKRVGNIDAGFNEWPDFTSAADLHSSYSNYHRESGRGTPRVRSAFIREVRNILELSDPQKRTNKNCSSPTKRVNMYDLPSITKARQLFNKHAQMDFEWPELDE